MAVSAFKSTSRRGNYTKASTSSSSSISTTSRDQVSRDSLNKTPIRRSRSVSAVQRGQLLREGYGTTRDNPLFDCSSGSSKSSSSERENLRIGKGRGDAVSTDKRGRMGRALDSAIVKPRERSLSQVNPVRRRLQSVSRGPSKRNESDYPSTDTDDGKIYETVRSEVQRAVSLIRDDLQNVIKGSSTTDMISDLDGAEISSDIRTDYASKIEKSQERIRKLSAELVVEEQRKEVLSKILKEFLSSTDSSESRNTRSKRRTSIERHEVSRRLEEEAMSYFEECVSISNFDESDLSSLEDPLPSSTACRQKLESDVFLSNEEIAFAESLISNNYEESENQRSISLTGSGMDFSHSSSDAKYPDPKPIYHSSDHISDYDTPSESFRFSFAQQPEKHTENWKDENYLGNFGKGCDEEKLARLEITRTRYDADDYISKGLDESLFRDMVLLKNRLNSGRLLLCNIRTF